ncbi:MAG: hypothetical protein LQ338_007098 [Usnochroma carphineum]|nr:MAG: hypothetical protein LQ338_007098 [Usnochroma carphineum]
MLENTRPVPYETTGEPQNVAWNNKKDVRAYLESDWGNQLFTAHGATSAEMPGERYIFTDYHYLWKACHKLGFPRSETEQAFRDYYLSGYLVGAANFENFWERYLDFLERRYDNPVQRSRLDRHEKKAAREWKAAQEWKEEQEEDLDEEEQEELEEKRRERQTLLQWFANAQYEWDEEAEEREAKKAARKKKSKGKEDDDDAKSSKKADKSVEDSTVGAPGATTKPQTDEKSPSAKGPEERDRVKEGELEGDTAVLEDDKGPTLVDDTDGPSTGKDQKTSKTSGNKEEEEAEEAYQGLGAKRRVTRSMAQAAKRVRTAEAA